MKTPITSILGASELLLTEERDDPEVRRRFLEHISAEAHRMHRTAGVDRAAGRQAEVEPVQHAVAAEGLDDVDELHGVLAAVVAQVVRDAGTGWIRSAFASGALVASLCSGSMLLSETGLLDGVTTNTYSYDRASNRRTKTDGADSYSYTFDRTDTLKSQAKNGGTIDAFVHCVGTAASSRGATSGAGARSPSRDRLTPPASPASP